MGLTISLSCPLEYGSNTYSILGIGTTVDHIVPIAVGGEENELEYTECNKLFKCCLFSFEDLINDGKLTIIGNNIPSLLIYRGWMLKPEQYEVLYNKLLHEGYALINTPEEYNRCHIFPDWYEDFKKETPFSAWTKGDSTESVLELLKQFQHAVI